MFDALLDDPLNPRFVSYVPVFLDELDLRRQLSAERLAAHIAGAVDGYHAGHGGRVPPAGDELHAVRDLSIEHLNRVTGTGTLRIDVWLDSLDATSCTYGFLCSNENGSLAYARGERTIVKLDPELGCPGRWSDDFLSRQASLLKTPQAYS